MISSSLDSEAIAFIYSFLNLTVRMISARYQPLLIPLDSDLHNNFVPGKSISDYNFAIRQLVVFAESSTFLTELAQRKLDYLLSLTPSKRWSVYLDSFD